ncbi:RND efflux transporter [Oceanococcus atlanticus]|uniref:RND efflux transporter n=1 Tax=Oceanococcus atlanticus TaxID=1317117 RepID=A0A1Y1SGW3_9GAMM|nr:efflux RND transporter permease subunit [Oceanococcus atlanticus]ORE88541.1 RND efflux transporter [Oceanococcus atlanticus]RZO85388.1 MAG: RND family transporter [Oceanococcus sp.]
MTTTDRIVAGFADKLLAHRKFFAVFFALTTLFFAWSASNVRLDPGFLKLIPIEHEYMVTMMDYMDEFSGANMLLVNVRWTGEGDMYNPEFFEVLEKVTNDVFFIPGIDRTKVSSLFTPDTYYIEVTEEGFQGRPVVPAEYSGSTEQLEQIRNNVENGGQIGLLVANDLKGALIRASLQEYDRDKDPDEEQAVDYWKVQQMLEDIRDKYENENIEINIIGFAKLLGDVIYGLLGVFAFFGLAFAITVLLLYLYTRSIKITITALVVAMLPVLWLIGLLPLIGLGIDPMSILVPFLIFSIGVSHAVQMTSAWRMEVGNGADSVEAAKLSFVKLFIPGAIALLTEALGFGVIMFIAIPIVTELGITACLGVLLMIITNKLVQPIILSYLTLEQSSIEHSAKAEQGFGGAMWDKVAACAEPRNAVWVFAVALALMALATWQSRHLVIGDSGVGVPELHEDSRYNTDNRKIAESYDIGVDLLTVIVEAPDFETDSCLQYPVISLIDKFELYMRGVDGVQSVTSVASVGKLVITAFNEGNPRWQALPRTSAGLSTGSKAFDPRLGLNSEGCRAIQVLIFTEDHEGPTIAHIIEDIKTFIADNPVDGVTMRLASGNVGVMAATNEEVKRAEVKMLLSLFSALILFCLISFRSWTALICVLVPLVGVTVMGNALMAMLDIGLKVATLPVIALGVGVGVDYGIYLFERIQHYMHDPEMSFREAFARSMRDRGSAIVFTALTMSVGVLTWMMSALKYQADMGLLLGFLFLVNMFGAICLLPALGSWFFRNRGVRNA